MATHSFTLPSPAGGDLFGLIDVPDSPGRRPVIVGCHGFKGFYEWGFWPPIAELLRQRGFAVVRFNFLGSGMRPGDDRVSDPAAFRANTYRREHEDLLAVLAALDAGTIGGPWIDPGRLGLLGHSRGGGQALLAAAHPDWIGRVSALVTWAAIGRIDRYSAQELDLWHRHGELPVVNARTGQELALGPELRDEVIARPPELDLAAAAHRRRAHWLMLHGDQDEAVPIDEGYALAEAAAAPAVFHAVRGGGHTFGAQHPFAGPTRELIEVFNGTQAWFRRYL